VRLADDTGTRAGMFIERASGVLLGAVFPPPVLTLKVADIVGRFAQRR
jgi:hypothetical protein